MTTLSPVDPQDTFRRIEPLINDSEMMVDALYAQIDEHFAVKANDQDEYVLSAREGERLFFLAGLCVAMTRKAREAYYVAWDNDGKKGGAQ